MSGPVSTSLDRRAHDFGSELRLALAIDPLRGPPLTPGWHPVQREDGTPGIGLVLHLYGPIAALYVDGKVDSDALPVLHATPAVSPPGNAPDAASYARACAALDAQGLSLAAIVGVARPAAREPCCCAPGCGDESPRCAARLARLILAKLPASVDASKAPEPAP